MDLIAKFLKELETDLKVMETAYKTAHDRSLFIKFVSSEAMKASLERNSEPRKFVYTSGKLVEVRMSIAGVNMRYVRIFDLPPELNDDRLSAVLGEYGKVDRVVREKFPADLGLDHMHTGIRGVYMEVKKRIPPTINIVGLEGRVFYEDLKDTCFLCHTEGHRKNTCPQRRTSKTMKTNQAEKSKDASYAGVVAGKVPVSTVQITPESMEDPEIIEVLEEELIDEDHASDMERNESAPNAVGSQGSTSWKLTAEKVEKAVKAIKEVMDNPPAEQRRAQFASSRSGSGPKKKCARKMFY